MISKTAGKYPQESYTAVVRAIQSEWIFIQSITWDMGDTFILVIYGHITGLLGPLRNTDYSWTDGRKLNSLSHNCQYIVTYLTKAW